VPVVGEAHIIVRAITTNVAKDIRNGFNGVGGVGGKSAQKAGRDMADRFRDGFNKNVENNFLTKLASGMQEVAPQAEASYNQINQLIVSGYKMSTVASVIAGAIGVIIGSLVSLVGAAAGAAASFTAVIGLFMSLKAATAVAKMAFNGIGEAVQQATQQQKVQAQTLRDLREELQQLKFDAEDAALAQEEAAISLEKAREGLARTADLPADSRSRREAELAYKQADLNYRRAKDRSADLNEELRTGAKAREAAAAKDPYANLTATQKGFAKFLVTLQPILKNLRESVARGFLPALQDGISRLITSGTFNDIYNGIAGIGEALGKASKVIFEFFSSAEAGKYLREIFDSIAVVVQEFGPILTKFFRAFLKIMAASAPITKRLADFISRMLDDFNGLLDKTGDVGLMKFFITASDMAGKFGTVFGNILKGFGKIIEANFGPGTGGDYLLNWLIQATEGFGTLGQGENGLKRFFNAVAVNAKKMFSGIGSIVKQIVLIGADPNIGAFFVKIKEAAPYFSSILKKAGQALPTVGALIVKIVEIVDRLTDNAAIDNFFKTLLGGADLFSKVLANPVVESVQKFTGQIHATVLGFMELKEKAELVGGFLFRSAQNVSSFFGKVQGFIGGTKQAFSVVGVATSGMKDGIKKTIDSFKKAAGIWPKFTSGVNQARDYTGLLSKQTGAFMTNATVGTRKALGSTNMFVRGWGRLRLAIETATLRFKIFQIASTKGFGQMALSQNKFIAGFGKVGGAMVGHPILMIVLALVAAFATLYATNDKFRKQINDVFKPALDALGEAFATIMLALQPVILAFKNLMNTLIGGDGKGEGPLVKLFVMLAKVMSAVVVKLAPIIALLIAKLMPVVEMILNILTPIIDIVMQIVGALMDLLMPVIDIIIKLFGLLVDQIMNIFMPVIDGIMNYLKPVMEFWMQMIQLIAAFFDALFSGDWDKFAKVFQELGHGIVQSLADMFTGLVNLIVDLLNMLIKLFTLWLRPIMDIVKDLTGGAVDIGAAIDAGLIPHMPAIVVPAFAEGGVVAPRSGGTLGVIAEAGRPERIEPLDENGLSMRDKAMIEMMGGGNGGVNMTINATPDMDVNALAAEVSRRLAFQMRKGAAY
jgi:phage-related protein